MMESSIVCYGTHTYTYIDRSVRRLKSGKGERVMGKKGFLCESTPAARWRAVQSVYVCMQCVYVRVQCVYVRSLCLSWAQ